MEKLAFLDMSFPMVMHALVGSFVVLSGALANLLSKGSLPHKFAGRLFVGAMLMMGPVVVVGAWFSPGSISQLGTLFVFFTTYLVVSAWSTIRHSVNSIKVFDYVAPLAALCIVIACLTLGFDTLSNASSEENQPPKEAYFFFAFLAFVSMLLDVNNLRLGGVRGKHRIVRHIWRMNCALFFATSTLFTGPGSIVFPESVRGNPLLSIPQFLVVVLTAFWVYRLLFSDRRSSFPTRSKTKSKFS